MASYYDVFMTAPLFAGADVLNRPCQVQFTYPGGALSQVYAPIKVLAWPTPALVRVVSQIMNIQHGWNPPGGPAANGGTISITTPAGVIVRNIANFLPA